MTPLTRILALVAAQGIGGGGLVLAAGELAVDVDGARDQVVVVAGNEPVATYVYRDSQVRRPYLCNLHAPGGVPVSRTHPPVPDVDADDHPTMHPGLWLAFGDLNGADTWRNKAQVEHVCFSIAPHVTDRGVQWESILAYRDSRHTLCTERCRVEIVPRPQGYLVIYDAALHAVDAPLAFGDQEEMGLGIRVATPLTVKRGGEMLDSEGRRNEKQIRAQSAAWCDYHGQLDGQSAGMLLLPDPANRLVTRYHARDYGVLVANPFAQRALGLGDARTTTIAAGETLRLRYAVLLHTGLTDRDAAYRDALAVLHTADVPQPTGETAPGQQP